MRTLSLHRTDPHLLPGCTGRAMPLRLLIPRIDKFYKTICLHCHFGELWQQQVLLTIQTCAAVLFTLGYQTRLMAIASWYLYTSLILRNTWLYFILDRYFYHLLFYSMFLPLDEKWSLSNRYKKVPHKGIIVNPATVRDCFQIMVLIVESVLTPQIRLPSNYLCCGFTSTLEVANTLTQNKVGHTGRNHFQLWIRILDTL
jgi:hypothetical protein